MMHKHDGARENFRLHAKKSPTGKFGARTPNFMTRKIGARTLNFTAGKICARTPKFPTGKIVTPTCQNHLSGKLSPARQNPRSGHATNDMAMHLTMAIMPAAYIPTEGCDLGTRLVM